MSASVASRAGVLGALTAAGQLLLVGTLPLYSRAFDPGVYGEYVIFVGSAGIVSVLAGLRYDSAVVLPRDDRVAAALTGLVLFIASIVAALIALATLAAQAWAPGTAGSVGRHFGLGLTAATLIGALQRCLTGWCVRDRRFMQIGVGQFGLSLVTVVAQLLLVRLIGQSPALVWGYVVALAVQTLCLLRPDVAGVVWPRGGSWRALRIAARKYRRFPTYMVGYALASTVRDRLIQVVLGIGAGADAVGRFGLAYRVAFAPNSLIYTAVSPIFYSIASRGGNIAVGRFAARVVETGFVMLVVPYVAFAIEAPTLTDELLSARWHGTGPYLRALAGPALMLAATCWLDRAFDSFRRQNVAFVLEASFTIASVALVAGLSRFLTPVSVVWGFAGLALIYYWSYFLMTFVACGFPLIDFRRACLTGMLTFGVALTLGALVHELQDLTLRFFSYAFLMAGVVAFWTRFRGGADILRRLMRSRVDDGDLIQ
jgi:O-antigen/teichoic acid export membrane protein